jgi:arabinofuranan 3-O-arabinosyltransferase
MEISQGHEQPWLLRPRPRLILSWLLALIASALALVLAWVAYDKPERRDGNEGHAQVDFGAQWILARMLITGQGPHLYDRRYLQSTINKNFPPERGNPKDPDAKRLFDWLIGGNEDNGAPADLGGPLYPPIHALLFAPLALLPPQSAYRLMQVLTLLLAWLGAWLIQKLAHGNVWWPVAIVLLLVYPGFAGAISLGQNPMLSLTLLLLGWLLLERDRPVAAGVAWGFLAFKPVWAVAFFLVPLLLRRWRFAAAMLLTGVLLALLTLPLVGLHAWLDWLALGRLASVEYGRFETWIFLSRDLQSIPRRWLLHFDDQVAIDAGRLLPTLLGVGLWLTVAAVTVVVTLRRWRPSTALEGAGAAFVLLGAWLSGYHFMYYDTLLTALPVCLLFTNPRRYLKVLPASWQYRLGIRSEPAKLLLAADQQSTGEGANAAIRPPHRHWFWEWTPIVVCIPLMALPYLCALLDPSHHYPPFDTFCLLSLWTWCGWSWQRGQSEPIYLLNLGR